MRSHNPVFNDKTFDQHRELDWAQPDRAVMTVQGAAAKTAVLLLLSVASGAWTWQMVMQAPQSGAAQPWIVGGLIGGLIFALATIFAKRWSAITAPLFALCEGLLLGGVSAMFESRYPGIVFSAVGLTMATLCVMLAGYMAGILRATPRFVRGVVAATGAVFVLYLVNFVLNMFGMQVPYLHSSGPIGIGINLVIVVIAALNLVLDFDLIERGAEERAPKWMEWYASFALMITLVWLYLEMLRLLSKFRD